MQITLDGADDYAGTAGRMDPHRGLRLAVQIEDTAEYNTGHDEICNKILAALIPQADQLHSEQQQIYDVHGRTSKALELLCQLHGTLFFQVFHGFYKIFFQSQDGHLQFHQIFWILFPFYQMFLHL